MMSTTTSYHVGWLIDGSGRKAVENQVITVKAGKVLRLFDVDDPHIRETDLVDLTTCTVFPALIDSHVHMVMSGTTDPAIRQKQLSSTYADRRKNITDHLYQYLSCGVLAVRDGGDHNGDTLRYKLEGTDYFQSSVTIAAAGRARYAPGRYGKFIGTSVETGSTLSQSTSREIENRDHLKLVNSGLNSLTQFGVESPPQFTESEMASAISVALEKGQRTMVHANGHIPVKLAINAGCHSIEHGFFMGKENMHRMADRGVVWVPTAVTMKAYQDYLKLQGHRSDPSFADVSRRNLDHQLEQISMARQLGVTIALGTDAGSPGVHHGLSVRDELQLFVTAGFSVEMAIRCASRHGTLLMGMADRGRISPGMRADFIAIEAEPEKVPEMLHQIAHLVVKGREVVMKQGY